MISPLYQRHTFSLRLLRLRSHYAHEILGLLNLSCRSHSPNLSVVLFFSLTLANENHQIFRCLFTKRQQSWECGMEVAYSTIFSRSTKLFWWTKAWKYYVHIPCRYSTVWQRDKSCEHTTTKWNWMTRVRHHCAHVCVCVCLYLCIDKLSKRNTHTTCTHTLQHTLIYRKN